MPVRRLTREAWQRGISRVLWVGVPGSRKTTGALTFPRPTGLVVYPGEGGYSAIPGDDPSVMAFVFEQDDALAKVSPGAIIKEIEQTTFDLIGGKYGEIKSFVGDGLPKLHRCYLNEATQGAVAAGEDFDPRAYGKARDRLIEYLSRVKRSTVPYVGFTSWDDLEKDDAQDKSKDASQHIWVGLPGKLSKDIVGEFGCTLYCSLSRPVPGQPAKATWQTAPGGKVWCAQIKCPPEVAARIPLHVPADWAQLEALILNHDTQKEAA